VAAGTVKNRPQRRSLRNSADASREP